MLAKAYAEVLIEIRRDDSAMNADAVASELAFWATDEDLIRWATEIKRRAERHLIKAAGLDALRWFEALAERTRRPAE